VSKSGACPATTIEKEGQKQTGCQTELDREDAKKRLIEARDVLRHHRMNRSLESGRQATQH
jgi:hypothetical protein